MLHATLLCKFLCVLLISDVHGLSYRASGAYDVVKFKTDYTTNDSAIVDLGYEIYKGVSNATTGLNTFLGIRYAAAPIGKYRWQPPQTPSINRSQIISAAEPPSRCPQSLSGGDLQYTCPGLADSETLPEVCAKNKIFQENITGSEDCLFLNLYAPMNKTNLPVFVYIHGGGYGQGSASQQDLTNFVQTNNNGFIAIAIQYRLGAFGFLSSSEVHQFGIVNAGLFDQHLALQWVHDYIHLFGGDPSKVTIAGDSAGGGSVMLQDMAYGGTQGNSLFQQVIAASPGLVQQFEYASWIPTQSYYAFAQQVGCFTGNPYGNNSGNTIFECLVNRDTLVLQQASATVSNTDLFGQWSFNPVTDGTFVQQLHSQQLLKQKTNAKRMFSGNNANEGAPFVPQNIQTEDDLVAWLRRMFPLFTSEDVSRVLYNYPSSNASVNPNSPLFATSGDSPPTALNQSTYGTGQQQRADDMYAESVFMCPSYWLVEAYSARGPGYAGYKYQFSVPPAEHGIDQLVVFGYEVNWASSEFQEAFMKIWGNFIIQGDPSIPATIANGNSSDSTPNPASEWPLFSSYNPYMIDLNITGGTPHEDPFVIPGVDFNVSDSVEPGLKNQITKVSAYEWEGGRGARCQMWRALGSVVPE